MYRWLQRVWYGGSPSYQLLLPLSGVYWLVIAVRRCLYRVGLLGRHRAAVPVIVVGNITAGGTGKTPVTIWLAGELRERGFSPGIVSRGYGGARSGTSMRVDSASDPADVGDEPVLLARRTGCGSWPGFDLYVFRSIFQPDNSNGPTLRKRFTEF